MRATVVGAGVSGLTTALAMLEAGWHVDIVARDTYESTVSMVAAAVWTMTAAEPHEDARRWALAGRHRFASIVDHPESGVVRVRQRELERHDPGPSWWESTPFVRRISSAELPMGYQAGFEIDGLVIEPPLYLEWLSRSVTEMGARVTVSSVARLEDVSGDLIVNCTGLGARDLVDDSTMVPIRGQVVAVVNPGIRDAIADESDPDRIAYVYPRSREVVLGGTRELGRSDAEADASTTERILADCAALDPRVRGLEVLEVRVGVRPGRPTVRLERGRLLDGRPVIHNYGHGGAGFILSWGCALDVTELAGDAHP